MIWHNSTIQDVLNELNTDKNKGLYNEAAAMRLKQYGKNQIKSHNKKGYLHFFIKEFKSFFVILLTIISSIYAIVTLVTSETGWLDSVIVITTLLMCCSINAFAKYKTNKTLYGIESERNSYVSVIRNGEETVILSTELVPGDIMIVKSGDYIKADARLIDSYALACDEFKLTGISVPTEKNHELCFDDITPLSSRSNMLYSSSTVINGKGIAVVTDTGYSTEYGKIKKLQIQTEEVKSPLSDKIEKISKIISSAAIIASVLIFIFGIIFNFTSQDASFAKTVLSHLLLSTTLCFIAVPDIIRSLMSVALSCSAERLKASDVTVNNLQIIEKLRNITVICTDKTGVITTGNMKVEKICTERSVATLDNDAIDESSLTILRLALICSNFKSNEHSERHTNNMERAIEEACIKYNGMSKSDVDGIYPTLAEIPFDSERMLMTTVSAINGNTYAVVKGAPEIVAERCINISAEEINKISDELTNDGLKAIAVAINPLSEIPANPNCEELEHGLTFVGLIGFADEIDDESYKLCKECLENGIKIVMISGDHINTTSKAALSLGIIDDENMAITGEEIAKMSDEDLEECIEKYRVFARVSPEDKLRIVTTLKSRFENVAVTGDTASDAAVIANADVGYALGLSAADVINDSSDLVLEKNRISSLISSLKESQYLLYALKNCSYYLIADIAIKLLVVIFGIFIFGASPLSMSAIMLLTLITAILPKYAFFIEKNATEDSLQTDSLQFFNKSALIKTITASILITMLALIGYGMGIAESTLCAQSFAFAVIAFSELAFAFSLSTKSVIFKGFRLTKKSMPVAVLLCFIFSLIILTTPLSLVLSPTPITILELALSLFSGAVVLVLSELSKVFLPKLSH